MISINDTTFKAAGGGQVLLTGIPKPLYNVHTCAAGVNHTNTQAVVGDICYANANSTNLFVHAQSSTYNMRHWYYIAYPSNDI